jgi:hypothetical protein
MSRSMKTATPLLLLAALGSGCAAPIEGLVARAQFDLSCPEADLRIVTLDSKTRGVTGCGRKATYLEVCDMTGWGPMNCRWVANSPETGVAPAAPVPPPAPPR